jgi:hypothetical protein
LNVEHKTSKKFEGVDRKNLTNFFENVECDKWTNSKQWGVNLRVT